MDNQSGSLELSGILSESYQALEESYEMGNERSFENRLPLQTSSPDSSVQCETPATRRPLTSLSANSSTLGGPGAESNDLGAESTRLAEALTAQREVRSLFLIYRKLSKAGRYVPYLVAYICLLLGARLCRVQQRAKKSKYQSYVFVYGFDNRADTVNRLVSIIDLAFKANSYLISFAFYTKM